MTIKEIKDYMKINGITQVELSNKSNIPIGTLNYIFSNRVKSPRLDTMNAICKALNIDTSLQTQAKIVNFPLTYKNQIVVFDNSGNKNAFNFKHEQLELILKMCKALTDN